MSNAIYPTLPGLTPKVSRTAVWESTIKGTASGREYAGAIMTSPRYRYRLEYEFLRDAVAFGELATLVGFFNARRGRVDSFLFTDPTDNAVAEQSFGTGDGSTTLFQLVRTYGGNVEPVYDPVITSILVNGVAVGYTQNNTGGITFNTAPAAAATITWTGSFYWRCRFTDDTLTAEQFMAELWSAKAVSFITRRP